MRRQDVVAEALTWISTPYHHQASVKGVGVDCVGLLSGVARALQLPDVFEPMSQRGAPYRAYGRTPNPVLMDAGCAEYLDQIPVAQAGLGDILRMRFKGDVYARHFAIITHLDPLRVVHAYAQARKAIEAGMPDAEVLNAYRFRGVD